MARRQVDVELSEDGESPKKRQRSQKKARPSIAESSDEEDEQEQEAASVEDVKDVDESERPSSKRRRTHSPASQVNGHNGTHLRSTPPVRRDLGRDADGFVPGSIVRIAASNFLTYESVEFHLGPRLNMIIGPNGSGKSSIVCAVAVALGFPLKVLARATEAISFIKHGCNVAWVEIELKGPTGRRNVVIKRTIKKLPLVDRKTKDPSQSAFSINGKETTLKAVKQKVAELDVDITNLCCFLPQDRVQEFSKLDSKQLLASTQEAAGAAHLAKWHQGLIEKTKRLTEEADKLASLENQLRQKTDGMRALERDYARFKERREIEKNLKVLLVAIPFAKYQRLKTQYENLREQKRAAEAALARLLREHEPYKRTRSMLTQRCEKFRQAHISREAKLDRLQADVRQREAKLAQLGEEIEILRSRLEDHDKEERTRQKTMQTLRQTIQTLQDKINGPPPEHVDVSDLDRQIRDYQQQLREVRRDSERIREEQRELESEVTRHNRNIDLVNQRLAQLHNVDSQRRDNFRKVEPNTFKAMDWIQRNSQNLQIGCYDPVALCVTIKDWQYAAAIETLIPNDVLRTLIAKSRADFDTLILELNDKNRQNLRVNVVEVEEAQNLASYVPPFSRDILAQHGFDCWALDVIEGPEDVLAYLCASCNLHRIPLAIDDTAQGGRLETQNSGVRRYVAGNSMTTLQFSRYGNREAFTASRFLQPVRYFSRGVDQDRVNRCTQEIRDLLSQKADTEKAVQDLVKAHDDVYARGGPISQQKNEVESRKKTAQASVAQYEKAKVDLETAKSKLARAEAKPSGQENFDRVNQDIKAKARRRKGEADALKALLLRMFDIHIESTTAGFGELQAKSDRDACDGVNDDQLQQLHEHEQTVRRLATQQQEAREAALALHSTAEGLLRKQSPEIFEAYQALLTSYNMVVPELEDLEQQQTEAENSLQMTAAVAGSVQERYEQRKLEIEELTERVDEGQAEKAKMQRDVGILKDRWEPAIRQLVVGISDRFSTSFSQMQLQGEVRVAEHAEDYAKWGIEIMVAFRDTEAMRPLSGTQHSGGEKSLSTICYLMALTTLNNAPFTVVDEINQGMDQRAERAMHNQLVKTTCEESANQYFLITPKLLTGLDYHPKMRILCVCNGDWAPSALPLADILRAKRQALGR